MVNSSSAPSKRRCAVGSVKVCQATRVVEHEDDGCPRVEVLRHLREYLWPAVTRREDLDYQVGRRVEVAIGQRPLGNAGETVEGNISPSHRVGASFGNDARVITEHATQVAVLDTIAKDSADPLQISP